MRACAYPSRRARSHPRALAPPNFGYPLASESNLVAIASWASRGQLVGSLAIPKVREPSSEPAGGEPEPFGQTAAETASELRFEWRCLRSRVLERRACKLKLPACRARAHSGRVGVERSRQEG
eukprot:11688791-Alexandrium_andersonii.AAC.1